MENLVVALTVINCFVLIVSASTAMFVYVREGEWIKYNALRKEYEDELKTTLAKIRDVHNSLTEQVSDMSARTAALEMLMKGAKK